MMHIALAAFISLPDAFLLAQTAAQNQGAWQAIASLGGIGLTAWMAWLTYKRSDDAREVLNLRESISVLREKETNYVKCNDALASRITQQQLQINDQQRQINDLHAEISRGTQINKDMQKTVEDRDLLLSAMTHELQYTSRVPIVVASDNGTIVEANENAAALFGYTQEDMFRLHLVDLMPERYRDRHLQGVSRALAGYGIVSRYPTDFPVLKKDGQEEIKKVLILGWVSRDPSKTRFVAIFYEGDVTHGNG